ncbi:unnamed protein product [Phytomonas sp. EM1]|nr:unnamed protein product [Phytomonas sp. EM1]|eukprot:CCW65848.1 unnamed protein product [Phytomonas sp. isolate EM1]
MQDMFVRSKGPRVVILITTNQVDDTLCYSVGSAHLSGLPVVVVGYKMRYRGFLSKFDFVTRAIENAELKPEDVIIAMDSGTIFTGADLNPFLDRFIAESAASPEELDALAVRQGRAMAPVLISAEAGCWTPNIYETEITCKMGYESAYQQVREYAAAHPEHELSLPFDLSPRRHLNAGSVIARVWAYKELIAHKNKLMRMQKARYYAKYGWYCDQSIYAALYLDLIAWEVKRDVFSMPMDERQAARSCYGVRAGLYGIEYNGELSALHTIALTHLSELHDENWREYLRVYGLGLTHSQELTDLKGMKRFVDDLYKRAYTAHGENIYTRLAVPRWVGGKTATRETRITLTPPLLALKPKLIDTVNNNAICRTFPVVYHIADLEQNFTKVQKMGLTSFGLRWFVPIVHDPKAKLRAMQYLASAPWFLSTHNAIIKGFYHAKCGFPFEKAIQQAEDH